jgi:hypothetical protein
MRIFFAPLRLSGKKSRRKGKEKPYKASFPVSFFEVHLLEKISSPFLTSIIISEFLSTVPSRIIICLFVLS